jgi:hypothetical protein
MQPSNIILFSDSKFLHLIMKHLQGLILMKDEEDEMHPANDN